MPFQTALLSKTGGRKLNEDYCAYREQDGFGIYLLADGLGGHQGGAVAASLVVNQIRDAFASKPGFSRELLAGYLEAARRSFLESQAADRKLNGMKTTLVAILTDFRQALWCHLGDSRLYHFRAGLITRQTRDHSVPQRLVESGMISAQEIRYHEDRNRLTKAFDGGDLEQVEYSREPVLLQGNDRFLLCSDGWWEYVLEKEMEEDLTPAGNPQQWLALMEKRILSRAEPRHDNYTAVRIFC